MTVQTTIRQWGNSQGIRIPRSILDEAQMEKDDQIVLSVRDNQIIIEKPFVHRTFEERLAEYNGEISVSDFEWGEPAGKELL